MRSLILFTTAAALAASGCNAAREEKAGPSVSRNYQIGSFDKIEVAGPYEVTVATGPAPSVRASGPENYLEKMIVEVDGNTLKIHQRKKYGIRFGWSRGHKIVLQVTVPSLRGAEIAGSGGIIVDKVTGDHFEAGVAGSGDLRLGQIEVGSLSIGIAGAGEVKAGTGKARRVEYEIAGSGDIDGAGVASEDASVSIAGSGNVTAQASKTADVDIAGSGDVRISGGAKCNVSKAGSGNVHCS